MESKTIVDANKGEIDVRISREFELSCAQLFEAFTDPQIVSDWMGTKIVEWKCETAGHYRIQTSAPDGTLAFEAHGVVHELQHEKRIVRTFEMLQMGLGIQLEFYTFESIDAEHSRLNMHVIYESLEQRDKVLSMGYRYGIGMAHDRIQNYYNKQS